MCRSPKKPEESCGETVSDWTGRITKALPLLAIQTLQLDPFSGSLRLTAHTYTHPRSVPRGGNCRKDKMDGG